MVTKILQGICQYLDLKLVKEPIFLIMVVSVMIAQVMVLCDNDDDTNSIGGDSIGVNDIDIGGCIDMRDLAGVRYCSLMELIVFDIIMHENIG